ICSNKSWFDTYEVDYGGDVVMGDSSICRVEGTSTIKVKMYDSVDRKLGMVSYIPKLKKNLISLGSFDKNDYSYKVMGRKLIISKGSLVVMKGEIQHNCLYPLFLQICTMGKQSKVTFKQQDKENRSTGVLDYIRSDVWRPTPIKLMGGARN
ncbi:unnamed protein product, partial [Prunus brigantina]